MSSANVSKKNTRITSVLSSFFDVLGGIFKPVLIAIIGAGILQALRDILLLTGVIEQVSSSYIFLNAMGDAVFYFLPILLAYSSAVVFGATPFLSAAIAGFLMYPQITDLFQWAKNVSWDLTIFGVIPVTYAKYPSSVLPIIIIVWFQSKIEGPIRKLVPDLLKSILFPVLVMFITSFAALVVLGPIGTWIGDGLAFVIHYLNQRIAWLVPTLIGATSPFLVLTGSHYSLFPIATQNLAQLGYDTVLLPGMMVSNLALAGASFAVAIRSKNQRYKSFSASAGITSLFGISQSSLYGNAIPLKAPLIAAVAGGGAGGFYAGITSLRASSFVTPGLLSLVGYLQPVSNFVNAIIAMLIAFAVTFIVTIILGFQEPSSTEVDALAGGKSTESERKETIIRSEQAAVLSREAEVLHHETSYQQMLTEIEQGASLLAKYAGVNEQKTIESLKADVLDNCARKGQVPDNHSPEEEDPDANR